MHLFPLNEKKPLLSANPQLLSLGIFVLTLGPFAIGLLRQTWESPWTLNWLPFLMLILFVTGWFCVGAALRPRESSRKGLLLALISYLLVGGVWAIKIGGGVDFTTPVVMLFWPMTMAQTLGVFGLSN
ncbi:MAG TPA: hypothetical protein VFE94_04205 [Candidatus Paceibacterota bacterium]|nr:hypothetical protein [Candidatus Paceibacterota bacterium]